MDIVRNGNISSSEISSLLAMGSRDMTPAELEAYKKENPKGRKKTIESWPGQKALNYISECNFERRLGRRLDKDTNARPLSYGHLGEEFLFDNVLGTKYIRCSDKTIVHPFLPYYCGTPDGEKHEDGKIITVESKCPFSLKSFCSLVDPLYSGLTGMDAINAIRFGYTDKQGIEHPKHDDGEKFFQQCVSNSILQKTKECELIIFCPLESQLQDLRDLASSKDGEESVKYMWIAMSLDGDLPSLPDGGFYQSVNIFRFEPPQEDKTFIIETVKKAGNLLIKL